MSRKLIVPEDVYVEVQRLAAFTGCGEGEVVRRLLEVLVGGNEAVQRQGTADVALATPRRVRYLPDRFPRSRGARVELAGDVIYVDSVRDLFERVLRFLVKNGKREAVVRLLPYKTSSQRYLIADKPIHPNGNRFVVPVQHGALFAEAHKSYRTAVVQLQELLEKLGVSFRYLSAG